MAICATRLSKHLDGRSYRRSAATASIHFGMSHLTPGPGRSQPAPETDARICLQRHGYVPTRTDRRAISFRFRLPRFATVVCWQNPIFLRKCCRVMMP